MLDWHHRVIGHDPHNGLWLLHEGVPISCSTSRVRSANESEALAFSILNGEPVLPDAIVSGPQQQKYIHLEDEQKGEKFPNPIGIFDDDVDAPQGSSGHQELQEHQEPGSRPEIRRAELNDLLRTPGWHQLPLEHCQVTRCWLRWWMETTGVLQRMLQAQFMQNPGRENTTR